MIAHILSAMFSPRNTTIENPSVSLNDPAAFIEMFGGRTSEAGIPVNAEKAMSIAAVWQGLEIISGDTANATLNVYKEGDDRVIDKEHPSQFLVSSEWNDETPAYEGWQRLMVHKLLWQNGYAYIERRGGRDGKPFALYNLLPDRTFPVRLRDGSLVYTTEVGGEKEVLYPEEVLHVKGLSLYNDVGMELIGQARDSWGLALAAQGYGSKFFANGAQSAGILEIPASWDEKAAKNLEEGFSKRTSGRDNWFKTVILRDGAKFHGVTIDAQKSQMQDVREEQVRDSARFLNLLPFKLGMKDSVSYNSQEQGQIQYVTGCLSHHFAAISGECEMKLLTRQERRTMSRFMEHNYSKLIEVDQNTMAEVLLKLRQGEFINSNEGRRKLNMPKRTDPEGDSYTNPNTKSAGAQAPTEATPSPVPEKPTKPPNKVSPQAKAVVADAINRMARRVCLHARNAAKKPTTLVKWLDSKAHEHRSVFQEAVGPAAELVASMTGADASSLCCQWDGMFFVGLLNQIDELTKPPHSQGDLEKNVDDRCRQFEAAVSEELVSSL